MKGAKKKMTCLAPIVANAVVPLPLVSLTIVTSGNASSDLGTVKEIKKGRIERQQNGVWNAFGTDGKLFVRDKARTDSSGMAVLHLDGFGSFLVGPHTEYTLGDDPLNFKPLVHRGFVWFKSQLPAGALSVWLIFRRGLWKRCIDRIRSGTALVNPREHEEGQSLTRP
jgi:hypothetical protein